MNFADFASLLLISLATVLAVTERFDEDKDPEIHSNYMKKVVERVVAEEFPTYYPGSKCVQVVSRVTNVTVNQVIQGRKTYMKFKMCSDKCEEDSFARTKCKMCTAQLDERFTEHIFQIDKFICKNNIGEIVYLRNN